MIDDFTKINKKNIDLVINNMPPGEYTMLFSKAEVLENSSLEDRKDSFFLLEHECLDHGVKTKDCYGFKFMNTLYHQLIYKGF